MTPELAKHMRKIEDGNRVDRCWMEEERLAELEHLCDIVSRHFSIAREAASVRDRKVLGDYIRSGVENVRQALKVFKLLPPLPNANEPKIGDGGRSGDGP